MDAFEMLVGILTLRIDVATGRRVILRDGDEVASKLLPRCINYVTRHHEPIIGSMMRSFAPSVIGSSHDRR